MQKGNPALVPIHVLFTQLEVSEDCPVPVDVRFLKVIKEFLPFSNKSQQALLGGKIFLVFFQVPGKVADSMSKKGNLRLRRASVFQFFG